MALYSLMLVGLRRIRPREGILFWSLSSAALVTLGIAFSVATSVPGAGYLTLVPLVGLMIAGTLARLPFPWWVPAAFLVWVGGEVAFGLAGNLLPPLSLIVSDVTHIVRWLVNLFTLHLAPPPRLTSVWLLTDNALTTMDQLRRWLLASSARSVRQDEAVFLLIALWLGWLAGAWAGWHLVRRRDVPLALLPCGILLSALTFFSSKDLSGMLTLFVASLLLLMLVARQHGLELRWTRQGADYSEEIRTEVILLGVVAVAAIVAFAYIVPLPAIRATENLFWDVVADPWRTVEGVGERLFPSLGRSVQSPLGIYRAAGEVGLPRAHLLGGSPDLERRLALRVWMPERAVMASVWAPYWRMVTYNAYDGRGWKNDIEVTSYPLDAGASWLGGPLDGRVAVSYTVELAGSSKILVGLPEPVSADAPLTVRSRGDDDLIALEFPRALGRYRAVSLAPLPTVGALRDADEAFPQQIAAHYLQLPDDVPQRVVELAVEVTRDGETSYDKARALESYLRQIPYTLDVPMPPTSHDVVDWFLFDLQEGYCDYYATAFVVMARAVGIPARLAVGYVTGAYDERTERYIVTEADAHSWPEVYFADFGWIPFEPTGGRAAIQRSLPAGFPPYLIYPYEGYLDMAAGGIGGQANAHGAASGQLSVPFIGVRPGTVSYLVLLSAVAFLLAILLWRYLRSDPSPRQARISTRWAHLGQWGARLGRPPAASETPLEYASALAVRWPVLQRSVYRLAQAFTASRYGLPGEGEGRDRSATDATWLALVPILRRLWIQRTLRRLRR